MFISRRIQDSSDKCHIIAGRWNGINAIGSGFSARPALPHRPSHTTYRHISDDEDTPILPRLMEQAPGFRGHHIELEGFHGGQFRKTVLRCEVAENTHSSPRGGLNRPDQGAALVVTHKFLSAWAI